MPLNKDLEGSSSRVAGSTSSITQALIFLFYSAVISRLAFWPFVSWPQDSKMAAVASCPNKFECLLLFPWPDLGPNVGF